MTRSRLFVAGGAAFALTTAAVVIVGAGYYESAGLLVAQIALIAGPTLAPFLILCRRPRLAIWITIALLTAVGWSYTVYVDTRPYQGGGASFAILFGWFGCACVSLGALVALLATRPRDRNGRWSGRPNSAGQPSDRSSTPTP